MYNLLSYGAGVNSTAMILLMEDACEFRDVFPQLHIVFADTGAENPETYAYLKTMDAYLFERGQRIVRVSAEKTLLEMCHERHFLPSRLNRWCTVEAKLNPLWDYEQEAFSLDPQSDAVQLVRYIGIDAGEAHRVRVPGQRYIHHRYPLIEYDLNRTACQRLIEKRGLPVPRKSGCFFCPFTSRYELAKLSIEHPDLFQAALHLEQAVNAEWSERSEPFYLISGLSLEALREKREAIMERYLAKQRNAQLHLGLFDEIEEHELEEKLNDLPCLCGR